MYILFHMLGYMFKMESVRHQAIVQNKQQV